MGIEVETRNEVNKMPFSEKLNRIPAISWVFLAIVVFSMATMGLSGWLVQIAFLSMAWYAWMNDIHDKIYMRKKMEQSGRK